MTNLYEIALPTKANDGSDYASALIAWEAKALQRAGGFTRRPDGEGAWADQAEASGPIKVYRDTMRPFRVACEQAIMDDLLRDAFKLFPDQLAIFVATIGTAEIVYRPGTKL